jgi:AcrR family transcriptional regulator
MSVKERHRRERSARRNTILDAAAAVFAKHGLEGATIEMVARRAEVAVGTIYLYFSSRDDLFLQLTAERIEDLVASYREIQSRALAPIDELHAMAGRYTAYLRSSREIFLTQHGLAYAQIKKRLKRKSEIEHYDRVIELAHTAFELWEDTVGRAYEIGLIPRVMDLPTTASIMWASINGAFLLTGQDNIFREVTGLNPASFIEQAFDFHLKAAQALAGHHNGDGARANGNGAKHNGHKDNGAKAFRAQDKRNSTETGSEDKAALL